MQIKNMPSLKINSMSQEQFEREKAAGNIKGDALYLTPGADTSVSYDEEQNLSTLQKARARNNIGAIGNDLNIDGLRNVTDIQFTETANDLPSLYVTTALEDDDPTLPVMEFGGANGDEAVALRGIADGRNDNDAVNLKQLNAKSSRTLLWENASPGSSFAAQTLIFGAPMSAYSLVEIHCVSPLMSPRYSTVASMPWHATPHTSANVIHSNSSTGGWMTIHREFSVKSANQLIVDPAYIDATVNNVCLVPYRIYGIV